MGNNCLHTEFITIIDKNWNESLPVKSITICAYCGTEMISYKLYPTVDITVQQKKTKISKQGLSKAMLKYPPSMAKHDRKNK